MLGSVTEILRQFKRSWCQELEEEAILQACKEAGHTYRKRDLDPVTTIKMFLLQILYGNVACNYVPHLAGKDVTGSAYCAARGRLPVKLFELLLGRCTKRMAECARDTGLWLGHRLFMTDGSGFSMPDTDELREHFGQPGTQREGCGFPTAHWLALVHFGSRLFQKVYTAPLRTADLNGVTELHPELAPGDVLLGDRAFGSFGHFALLIARGVQGIFRAHGGLNIDFTPQRVHSPLNRRREINGQSLPHSRWIQSLGDLDQIVEWSRPYVVPKWLTKEAWLALPKTLLIRELRYTIARPGFRVQTVTLTTTLLDPVHYPKEKLAEAYGLRWTIETCFQQIKTTLKMDVLHCETVRGIQKELHMFLLVYNLVRMVMLEAAQKQGVPPERISFADALRWLATARPGKELGELVTLPIRPGRLEPRVRKRRPKGPYALMMKPRSFLRQALTNKGVAT
jgi:hypothetical protein